MLSGTGSRGTNWFNKSDTSPTYYDPREFGRVYIQSHWGAQVEFKNPIISGTLVGM